MCDLSRICPICVEIIIYSNSKNKKYADDNNCCCSVCLDKNRITSKSRECPMCKEIIIYSSISKKKRADDNNCSCRTCSNKSRIGDNHPMFGKESAFKGRKHTEESKKLISNNHPDVSGVNNPMYGKGGMLGKKHTIESKDKMSKVGKNRIVSSETKDKISNSKLEYYKNNINVRKGITLTDETKCKMRLARIRWIEETENDGNPIYPCYNKSSIKILEEYSSSNKLQIKHAENGGEFYIKELGYWLDAYDVDKNIAIEFNEKHHKYQKDKDDKRRNLIMEFLRCDFHIINEDSSIEIYKYK